MRYFRKQNIGLRDSRCRNRNFWSCSRYWAKSWDIRLRVSAYRLGCLWTLKQSQCVMWTCGVSGIHFLRCGEQIILLFFIYKMSFFEHIGTVYWNFDLFVIYCQTNGIQKKLYQNEFYIVIYIGRIFFRLLCLKAFYKELSRFIYIRFPSRHFVSNSSGRSAHLLRWPYENVVVARYPAHREAISNGWIRNSFMGYLNGCLCKRFDF